MPCDTSILESRAGFCWWGPEANIEDGSSFIGAVDHIKDQRTGLINTTFILGGPYWWGARGHGPLDLLNPALESRIRSLGIVTMSRMDTIRVLY